jgi:ribosomal protein L40E
MECIHCGAQVPESAVFCHDCGEKMQRSTVEDSQKVCPACHTAGLVSAKFCRNCGKALDADTVSETDESLPAPLCPYCGSALKKVPKRKTLCPSCREPIYIRSRPSDRKKTLVTQEQADEIEEEWTIHYEANDLDESDRERFEQIRQAIKEKYGREVPKKLHSALHDIRWSSYNREGLDSIRKSNFGLFRNTRLRMAQQMKEEKKYKRALEFYLEVCYIDLNGPRNNQGLGPEMLKEFPNFDPREAFLAPYSYPFFRHQEAQQISFTTTTQGAGE